MNRALWDWHAVWFSRYGNLVETAREFVEDAESGVTARELESLLQVECKRSLLKLYRKGQVVRVKIGGVQVYLSNHKGKQRSQKLCRKDSAATADVIAPQVTALSHELKAAIILFFSLLDERQRRLYADLESQKFGRGGDRKLAKLLGLDAHTVAKGRRDIFSGEIDRERIPARGRWAQTPGEKTPQIIQEIERLMEHDTAGDPISGLKWSRRTTEKIAKALCKDGIQVG